MDPYGKFNFRIEIDGIVRGAFSEVSGLDATVDVTEYREGGDLLAVRKLPGITRYSNITLRWGLTSDDELYRWHQSIVDGDIDRRNGSVIVLDRLGEEAVRWNFVRAWPVKWDPGDFSATSNETAVVSLELAHEGIRKA